MVANVQGIDTSLTNTPQNEQQQETNSIPVISSNEAANQNTQTESTSGNAVLGETVLTESGINPPAPLASPVGINLPSAPPPSKATTEQQNIITPYGTIIGTYGLNSTGTEYTLESVSGQVTIEQSFKGYNSNGQQTTIQFPAVFNAVLESNNKIGFQATKASSSPIDTFEPITFNGQTFYTQAQVQPKASNGEIQFSLVGGGGNTFQTTVPISVGTNVLNVKGSFVTGFSNGQITGEFEPLSGQTFTETETLGGNQIAITLTPRTSGNTLELIPSLASPNKEYTTTQNVGGLNVQLKDVASITSSGSTTLTPVGVVSGQKFTTTETFTLPELSATNPSQQIGSTKVSVAGELSFNLLNGQLVPSFTPNANQIFKEPLQINVPSSAPSGYSQETITGEYGLTKTSTGYQFVLEGIQSGLINTTEIVQLPDVGGNSKYYVGVEVQPEYNASTNKLNFQIEKLQNPSQTYSEFINSGYNLFNSSTSVGSPLVIEITGVLKINNGTNGINELTFVPESVNPGESNWIATPYNYITTKQVPETTGKTGGLYNDVAELATEVTFSIQGGKLITSTTIPTQSNQGAEGELNAIEIARINSENPLSLTEIGMTAGQTKSTLFTDSTATNLELEINAANIQAELNNPFFALTNTLTNPSVPVGQKVQAGIILATDVAAIAVTTYFTLGTLDTVVGVGLGVAEAGIITTEAATTTSGELIASGELLPEEAGLAIKGTAAFATQTAINSAITTVTPIATNFVIGGLISTGISEASDVLTNGQFETPSQLTIAFVEGGVITTAAIGAIKVGSTLATSLFTDTTIAATNSASGLISTGELTPEEASLAVEYTPRSIVEQVATIGIKTSTIGTLFGTLEANAGINSISPTETNSSGQPLTPSEFLNEDLITGGTEFTIGYATGVGLQIGTEIASSIYGGIKAKGIIGKNPDTVIVDVRGTPSFDTYGNAGFEFTYTTPEGATGKGLYLLELTEQYLPTSQLNVKIADALTAGTNGQEVQSALMSNSRIGSPSDNYNLIKNSLGEGYIAHVGQSNDLNEGILEGEGTVKSPAAAEASGIRLEFLEEQGLFFSSPESGYTQAYNYSGLRVSFINPEQVEESYGGNGQMSLLITKITPEEYLPFEDFAKENNINIDEVKNDYTNGNGDYAREVFKAYNDVAVSQGKVTNSISHVILGYGESELIAPVGTGLQEESSAKLIGITPSGVFEGTNLENVFPQYRFGSFVIASRTAADLTSAELTNINSVTEGKNGTEVSSTKVSSVQNSTLSDLGIEDISSIHSLSNESNMSSLVSKSSRTSKVSSISDMSYSLSDVSFISPISRTSQASKSSLTSYSSSNVSSLVSSINSKSSVSESSLSDISSSFSENSSFSESEESSSSSTGKSKINFNIGFNLFGEKAKSKSNIKTEKQTLYEPSLFAELTGRSITAKQLAKAKKSGELTFVRPIIGKSNQGSIL